MTKLIAFDLDGTLAQGYDKWPGPENIGPPNPAAMHLARLLHNQGHKLAVWTCRADHVARRWLREYSLDDIFEYVNESPYPSDSRKASFDLLIDDKAMLWPVTSIPYLDKYLSGVENMGEIGDDFRDKDFCDRNLKVWYQGTGTMFTDAFEEQHRRIWDNWEPQAPIALLTICSHAKPYSKSAIHDDIRRQLFDRQVLHKVDYIHISNVGLIPSTHEMEYPWNAYDGNYAEATDEAKRVLRNGVSRRLTEWINNFYHEYAGVVIYLRGDGNTAAAVNSALASGPSLPKLTFVVADRFPHLPWVLDNDPDNTLRRSENIQHLVAAIHKLMGV